MVNEEQLLEALYSTMRFYEKKLKDCGSEYERCVLLRKLGELDVEIYCIEEKLQSDGV